MPCCPHCGGNVPWSPGRCAAFECTLPPVRCALHIDEERNAALAERDRAHSKLLVAARAAYDALDVVYEATGLDEALRKVHQDLGEALGALPVETFWIYPGERRTVVVKASFQEEAERLVRENPHYDGFSIVVYKVDEFEENCRKKEFCP